MQGFFDATKVEIADKGTYDLLAQLEVETDTGERWWEFQLNKSGTQNSEAYIARMPGQLVFYTLRKDLLGSGTYAPRLQEMIGENVKLGSLDIFITSCSTVTVKQGKPSGWKSEKDKYQIAEGIAKGKYVTFEWTGSFQELYIGEVITFDQIKLLK